MRIHVTLLPTTSWSCRGAPRPEAPGAAHERRGACRLRRRPQDAYAAAAAAAAQRRQGRPPAHGAVAGPGRRQGARRAHPACARHVSSRRNCRLPERRLARVRAGVLACAACRRMGLVITACTALS